MVQSQLNYTPAQLLDAARHAEADGRGECAEQLFRHLLEHFPSAPEAAYAHGSLARINDAKPSTSPVPDQGEPLPGRAQPSSNAAPSQSAPPPHAQQSPMTATAHHPRPQDPGAGPGYVSGYRQPSPAAPSAYHGYPSAPHGPQHRSGHAGAPPPGQSQQPARPPPSGQGLQSQRLQSQRLQSQRLQSHGLQSKSADRLNLEPVIAVDTADHPQSPSEPRLRRHPLGHLLAVLAIIVGACAITAGLALTAAAFYAPSIVGSVVGDMPLISSLTAAGLIVVGFALILNGLVARGVFANARAIHALALIEYQRRRRNSG